MAEAGKIYHESTFCEIDEAGNVWCVFNHFDSPTMLEDMQVSIDGVDLVEEVYDYDYEDDLMY